MTTMTQDLGTPEPPEVPYFTPAQIHAIEPDWILDGLSDADYMRACAMVAGRGAVPEPAPRPESRTTEERAARFLEIYQAELKRRGLPPDPSTAIEATEIPAPVAPLFEEAGITEETHQRCDEIDRYWLAVLREEAAGRGLPTEHLAG
jgi:hypothetical protein